MQVMECEAEQTYLRSPLETNPTDSSESATGFNRLPGRFPELER